MPTKEAKEIRSRRTAEDFAVFLESGYSLAQLKKIIRLFTHGASDPEWFNLQSRYDLPDDARFLIDNVIANYWDHRRDRTISKKLPGMIKDAASDLEKLRRKLDELRANPDFFKGVQAYYNPSPFAQAETLERASVCLGEVNGLLKQAQERMKGPRNRPTHRGLWWGLSDLENRMLTWGTQELNSSQKGFAFKVLHLADPMVTKPVFNTAFEDYLLMRSRYPSTA